MRRALVISLLIHVVLLSALLPKAPVSFGPIAVPGKPGMLEIALRPTGVRAVRPSDVQPASDPVPSTMSVGQSKAMVPLPGVRPKSPARIVDASPQKTSHASIAHDVSDHLPPIPSDAEAEYRLSLGREIRKYRVGTGVLREPNQTGTVVMMVSFWIGTPRPVVTLQRSSGQSQLDQMAVDALRMAIDRVSMPNTGARGGFRMPFVIEYHGSQ